MKNVLFLANDQDLENYWKKYIWHVFGMVLHICVIADLLCLYVYLFLH